MASPPFSIDSSDPADTSTVSTFPANERAWRAVIGAWVNTEHDTYGHHTIPSGSTSNRNSITTWGPGNLYINTDTSPPQLQMQTGSFPGSTWETVGYISLGDGLYYDSSNNIALYSGINRVSKPSGTSYSAAVSDAGNMISSASAGGNLTITLPETTTTGLMAGWTIAGTQEGTNTVTIAVNGTNGGHILLPSGQSVSSITLYNGAYEIAALMFDGTNFRVMLVTPLTAETLNMVPTPSVPQLHIQAITSSETWNTPAGTTTSTVFKFTVTGGGGGGGASASSYGGGGGGAGATAIYEASGVAAGTGVTVTVGTGGAGGTAQGAGSSGNNSSIVFNGTTVTAGGGSGGSGASASSAAGGNGGSATNGTVNIGGGGGGGNDGGPISGVGGSSFHGGGGTGLKSGVGITPTAYGAGGGGGGPGNNAGGAGAPGIVIVEWIA